MITDTAQTWQLLAACTTADPALFYGPPGEDRRERVTREREAFQVCAACPVTSDCVGYAIDRHIPRGVWGGMGEDTRALVFHCAVTRARSAAGAAL